MELIFGKLPNPDIAISYRIAVVLQRDWPFVTMWLEVGYSMWAIPTGTSLQLDMVMNEHAIVKYGECRFPDDLVTFESRPVENDIIRLPLARFSAGVGQRNRPAVLRSKPALGVGALVVVS